MSFQKQKVGGASSSKRTPPPPKVNQIPPPNTHGIVCKDQMQKDRYDNLVKRKIVTTRYFDENALATLGLLDEVKWLIDRVGWNQFLTIKSPSYEKLSLEFLSSVEAKVLYGGERKVPNDFNEGEFWYALIGSSFYTPSAAKASRIHNPCFKYIHRVMAHSMFGRGESLGNVKQTELFLLWAMVNALLVDTGSHLARQFSKMGKAVTGDIVIGGFITPIAQAFNIDLSNDRQILGSFSGPLSQLSTSIAKIKAAQEQQRLQLEAFRAEQREQIQNIELLQQRLEDMIQAQHQGDTEYKAMWQAMYHLHLSQGHFPPP
ncbi:hypothetical protein SESBI_25333 [Sesbania bispinosa]|nr:hypothetical protein SESBI_25333 [Sesbania bispinosa]